jgi:preprotein translocase subunit SecF
VIGFLTILGYSLYDTVVVFDKVRENTDHIETNARRTYAEAANRAVNQTLVRSINTSVVALLPVGSILFIGAFLLGAGTLKDISLSLFVGIAAGTYSSIFIATPMLVHLREREAGIAAHTQKLLRKRAERGGVVEDVDGPVDVDRVADAEVLATVGSGRGGASDDDVAGDSGEAVSGGGAGTTAGQQRQQPRRGGTAAQRRGRPGGRKR